MSRNQQLIAQANEHLDAGRFDQALALMRRQLQRQPGDPVALNGVAIALFKQGHMEPALFHAQQAAAADASNAVYLETLGTILGQMGRSREAAEVFAKAAALVPQDSGFRLGLSHALWDAGDLEGALRACAEAVRVSPGNPAVHAVYISVLQNLGDIPGAEAHAREALERFPSSTEILQALILTLNYASRAQPAEMYDLARRYGQSLVAEMPPMPPAAGYYRNAPEPDRRLRVGYLSPDLRRHSVGYFIEPVLAHHDRSQVEPYVYFTATGGDEFTARMRGLPAVWREAGRLDPLALAERIREDQIDILVELSGHTIGHRLATMARRPAPVGVTYLGYPNTTGVPGISARLVDAITDPPGRPSYATEKLVRLPGCFLCFRPDPEAPEPSAAPALCGANSPERPGGIVFGSFNNLAKLSAQTVELWARVVRAVPGARLILKFAQADSAWLSGIFRRRFESAGLQADRLEILGKIPEKAGHLSAYAKVDIALDPFPYGGTTTTCEALDMGVPVITMLGHTHAGRVGASLLTAAGLDAFIAQSAENYVDLARKLAEDHGLRAKLRGSLRRRLREGPLCDAATFTRGLEAAYREMWHAVVPRV